MVVVVLLLLLLLLLLLTLVAQFNRWPSTFVVWHT
jgi:hypothetical protein